MPSENRAASAGFGPLTLAPWVLVALGTWFLVRHPTDRTGVSLFRVGLIALGAVWLALRWLTRGSPADASEAAEQILTQQKAVYAGPHEFRVVAAARDEFRDLDHEWYDRTRSLYERLGFRFLKDIEDVTLTRQFANMRTFLRVMSGDGGRVMLAFAHVKIRGWMRIAQWIGLLPKVLKMIDLETELSDGSFVVTTNTKGSDTTGDVPGIDREQHGPETPPEALLELHRRHVDGVLADAAEELAPVAAVTFEQLIAAQHRLQAIKNAHKRATGYMTREELIRIAGEDSEQVQEVADAIEAKKRGDERDPNR